MVISKKTIIFQGFRGGPKFSKGVNFFQGGEGVQMQISIETHITCDFLRGVKTNLPPPPMYLHLFDEFQTPETVFID